MTPNDRLQILEAREHLSQIDQYLSLGRLTEQLVLDAVSFRLSCAIESLSKTSPEFRESAFGDNWQMMWAVRNRISHAYAYIDHEIISATVKNRLPSVRQVLDEYLRD